MALIKCFECGAKCSDTARECMSCEANLKIPQVSDTDNLFWLAYILISLIPLGLGIYIFIKAISFFSSTGGW